MAQAKSMAQNKNTKTTATTKLTASEEALKKEIVGKVNRHFGKVMEDATPHMVYTACALTVRDRIMEKWAVSHQTVKKMGAKKLYYLSFEFLMGRLLCTNILNLMQTEEYQHVLNDLGYSLPEIAELENDAGLGNGGLGRLAACFIEAVWVLYSSPLPFYRFSVWVGFRCLQQKPAVLLMTKCIPVLASLPNGFGVFMPE